MLLQPRLALVSIVVFAATDAAWLRAESPDDTTVKRRAVLELDFGALFGGADSQAAIEEREQEQAELRLLDELRKTVPYRQDAVITLPADAGSIRGFCVLPNDGLAVIAGASEGFGAALLASLFGDRSPPPPSRVHWLDPDGVVLRSATLDFAPKAVTAAADGSVFVVGEGTIARFDPRGAKELQVASPHLAHVVADREQFVADARERHREEVAQFEEQAAQVAETLREVEAKAAGNSSSDLAEIRQMAAFFTGQLEAVRAMSEDTVVQQALDKLKEIHGIAVTKDHVFVVTNESSGFNFCIWRMSQRLDGAQKIVGQLSGCCGQLDVQVLGDRLVVAENSRHRVLLVDQDGKTTHRFGESSRTDVTKGFGGCCNPMNTCCGADGSLLTSESNGIVKRYSADGEFQAVLGVAEVAPGCKDSSLGMARDGSRLYYFDVLQGRILVLRRKS